MEVIKAIPIDLWIQILCAMTGIGYMIRTIVDAKIARKRFNELEMIEKNNIVHKIYTDIICKGDK